MISVKVFLDEEYGYRAWAWDTRMDEASLIKWFQENLFKEDAYPCPENLCGEITETEQSASDLFTWRAHLNGKDDTWLQKPTGEIIRPNGWDEVDNDY